MPMPRNTWWGVKNAYTSAGYKLRLWGGRYPWGCIPGKYRNGRVKGNSRHMGFDAAAPTGSPVYAWGNGVVLFARYGGAYRRFIQIYYPKARMSHTLGHMLNRGYARAGTRVRRGQRVGYVGTRYDGINHSHIHHRVAYGRWRRRWIRACNDVHPIILWRKLAR